MHGDTEERSVQKPGEVSVRRLPAAQRRAGERAARATHRRGEQQQRAQRVRVQPRLPGPVARRALREGGVRGQHGEHVQVVVRAAAGDDPSGRGAEDGGPDPPVRQPPLLLQRQLHLQPGGRVGSRQGQGQGRQPGRQARENGPAAGEGDDEDEDEPQVQRADLLAHAEAESEDLADGVGPRAGERPGRAERADGAGVVHARLRQGPGLQPVRHPPHGEGAGHHHQQPDVQQQGAAESLGQTPGADADHSQP